MRNGTQDAIIKGPFLPFSARENRLNPGIFSGLFLYPTYQLETLGTFITYKYKKFFKNSAYSVILFFKF